MSPTIFVTAPMLADAGVQLLQAANATVLYLPSNAAPGELERVLSEHPVDAVISRTVVLSAEAMRACPTLRVISKHGVGVSNIDVNAASELGIPVFTTPGANAQSVAEMALGLLLSAARRINWMDAELREGRWSRAQDGLELHGRTLGLVGFGQIGQRMARACLALGMRVMAYDPARPADATAVSEVEFVDSLEKLLSCSQVLSLHVPLNSHTRNMLDARRLALLPPQAIIINTARGEVIDEPALIQALKSGHLFAAGLDTMVMEPLPVDSPLLELSNVVLTPHTGGSTNAALSTMARDAAQNVLAYLSNQTPKGACVNPAVLNKAGTSFQES